MHYQIQIVDGILLHPISSCTQSIRTLTGQLANHFDPCDLGRKLSHEKQQTNLENAHGLTQLMLMQSRQQSMKCREL